MAAVPCSAAPATAAGADSGSLTYNALFSSRVLGVILALPFLDQAELAGRVRGVCRDLATAVGEPHRWRALHLGGGHKCEVNSGPGAHAHGNRFSAPSKQHRSPWCRKCVSGVMSFLRPTGLAGVTSMSVVDVPDMRFAEAAPRVLRLPALQTLELQGLAGAASTLVRTLLPRIEATELRTLRYVGPVDNASLMAISRLLPHLDELSIDTMSGRQHAPLSPSVLIAFQDALCARAGHMRSVCVKGVGYSQLAPAGAAALGAGPEDDDAATEGGEAARAIGGAFMWSPDTLAALLADTGSETFNRSDTTAAPASPSRRFERAPPIDVTRAMSDADGVDDGVGGDSVSDGSGDAAVGDIDVSRCSDDGEGSTGTSSDTDCDYDCDSDDEAGAVMGHRSHPLRARTVEFGFAHGRMMPSLQRAADPMFTTVRVLKLATPVHYDPITAVGYEIMFRRMGRQLREVTLTTGSVDDEAMEVIGRLCPQITLLDVLCPTDKERSVSDVGIAALANGCLQLRSLAVRCIRFEPTWTDAGVAAIFRHLRHLKNLSLSCCRGVTDVSLEALADDLPPALHTLELKEAVRVTEAGVVALLQAMDEAGSDAPLRSLDLSVFMPSSGRDGGACLGAATAAWVSVACPGLTHLKCAVAAHTQETEPVASGTGGAAAAATPGASVAVVQCPCKCVPPEGSCAHVGDGSVAAAVARFPTLVQV